MKREEDLISGYLSKNLTEKEVKELDEKLNGSQELRGQFYDQVNVVTSLEEEFFPNLVDEKVITIQPPQSKIKLLAFAASFFVGVGLLIYSATKSPRPIATLVSNENAAWESALPTTVGSELHPGLMSLKAGVATIRFLSGAKVTLEAPAEIELNNEMEGELKGGNAIIQVPESAQGFVLVTPSGYAVDHGTSFGVSISQDQSITDFTVLDGEISVHSQNGDSLFLHENESVSLRQTGISKKSITEAEKVVPQEYNQKNIIRIQSKGKSQSIIRSDNFEYLDRNFLMVKLDADTKAYSRRSLFNIRNSEINWPQVKKVKLRLNLVPCGLGNRVYLPKINNFKVYALAGFSGIEWQGQLSWNSIPPLTSFHPVGDFKIPRSQERGSITIENPKLLNFLKKNNADEYTFLIIRKTPEDRGGGLVHAFASDSHPEASGPSLELYF